MDRDLFGRFCRNRVAPQQAADTVAEAQLLNPDFVRGVVKNKLDTFELERPKTKFEFINAEVFARNRTDFGLQQIFQAVIQVE